MGFLHTILKMGIGFLMFMARNTPLNFYFDFIYVDEIHIMFDIFYIMSYIFNHANCVHEWRDTIFIKSIFRKIKKRILT